MKRGFIRGLWGIFDTSNRMTRRRFRVARNIEHIMRSRFNEPFRTYIMGRENYKNALKSGVKDAVLLDENPFRFDLIKHHYRNKIEVLMHAMENDGYDEIIYLDWDCVPCKRFLSGYWDEFGKKEVFQANLQHYRRRKCFWRQTAQRQVPNGGFIYLRDKKFPRLAAEVWEKLGKPDTDETAWAKITDDMVGSWKGAEKYWELFESMHSNLHRGSPFDQPHLSKKTNLCFLHFQGGG